MNWPRGKYNGDRIVGFELKVRFDIRCWRLTMPDRYGTCLGLGPLRIWLTAAYDQLEIRSKGVR